MIKVVNCRKQSFDVYIGRGSKWGNPFVIGKDGNREQVISKYEAYIRSPQCDKLRQSLHELQDKTLGCYCAPKACHGDILKIMVEDEIWNK